MFCPNCASQNGAEHNYCRTCGLKLDAIAADLKDQRPSAEYALLKKKKERFEKLGLASISIAALVGFSLMVSTAFYYKISLISPEVLLWAGFAAFAVFALLAVFFFNYPKMFMQTDRVNPRLSPENGVASTPTTNKLLSDPPFEPASVTEHSTELLSSERKN